jgi:hypothetical protein
MRSEKTILKYLTGAALVLGMASAASALGIGGLSVGNVGGVGAPALGALPGLGTSGVPAGLPSKPGLHAGLPKVPGLGSGLGIVGSKTKGLVSVGLPNSTAPSVTSVAKSELASETGKGGSSHGTALPLQPPSVNNLESAYTSGSGLPNPGSLTHVGVPINSTTPSAVGVAKSLIPTATGKLGTVHGEKVPSVSAIRSLVSNKAP